MFDGMDDIKPNEIPEIKICDLTGKEYWSEIVDCTCLCHTPGDGMMHMFPCCDNGKSEIKHYLNNVPFVGTNDIRS